MTTFIALFVIFYKKSSSTIELDVFFISLYLKINIFFFGSVMYFIMNLSYSLLNLKFCSLQKVKSIWDLLIYVRFNHNFSDIQYVKLFFLNIFFLNRNFSRIFSIFA